MLVGFNLSSVPTFSVIISKPTLHNFLGGLSETIVHSAYQPYSLNPGFSSVGGPGKFASNLLLVLGGFWLVAVLLLTPYISLRQRCFVLAQRIQRNGQAPFPPISDPKLHLCSMTHRPCARLPYLAGMIGQELKGQERIPTSPNWDPFPSQATPLRNSNFVRRLTTWRQ